MGVRADEDLQQLCTPHPCNSTLTAGAPQQQHACAAESGSGQHHAQRHTSKQQAARGSGGGGGGPPESGASVRAQFERSAIDSPCFEAALLLLVAAAAGASQVMPRARAMARAAVKPLIARV